MPLLITVLRFFAFNAIGWLIAGAGIAFATYQGLQVIADAALNSMRTYLFNIPSDVLGILYILGVPQALSLWISGELLGMSVIMLRIFVMRRGG